MEHDTLNGSLINLSNFPAVARWSRIKDRQMNRSVGEEEKEEADVHIEFIQKEGVMDGPCYGP